MTKPEQWELDRATATTRRFKVKREDGTGVDIHLSGFTEEEFGMIAAAPDMLEALEGLLAFVETDDFRRMLSTDQPDLHEFLEALDHRRWDAQAAITKAHGTTPQQEEGE